MSKIEIGKDLALNNLLEFMDFDKSEKTIEEQIEDIEKLCDRLIAAGIDPDNIGRVLDEALGEYERLRYDQEHPEALYE